MKYCKSCIIPSTRPDQFFDDDGICIACKNFEKRNVDFHSLSSYDFLLEQALEINYISNNEFKILKEWKKNPSEWKI